MAQRAGRRLVVSCHPQLGQLPEIVPTNNMRPAEPTIADPLAQFVVVGRGGSVQVPVDEQLRTILTRDFSIEFWVKLDAASGDQVVLRGGGITLGVSSDILELRLGTAHLQSAQRVAAEEWTHLAIEVQEGIVRLYLNGGVVAKDQIAMERERETVSGRFIFGGASDGFLGEIDNIRISDQADWGGPFSSRLSTKLNITERTIAAFSFDNLNGVNVENWGYGRAAYNALLDGFVQLVGGEI